MTGRRIGLLLLILVMGGAVDAAWFLRQNIGVGPTGCRVVRGRFYGPSFTFSAEETRPLAAASTVEIENAFGAVRVAQAPASELRVSLRKVVYRNAEDVARAFADRIQLKLESGAVTRVTTNREDLERSDRDVGFETHMEVFVPAGTSVVVRNEHGRIDVADVAAADVSGSFEPVRVERVGGVAEVRARHGDVYVSGVGGTLAVSARHGAVQLEDVQGACTLDVEHGDATLLRVGSVRIQAAHGDLGLQDVRGDLEVVAHHAGVRAEDVKGRATIETSLNPIEVRRIGGEARLKTEHGGISASDLDGPLTAEGSFEDMTVARVAGVVDVRVSHGSLRASDLPKGGRVAALGGEVRVERFAGALQVEAERSALDLQPAGALTDTVIARTTFGDIRLRVPEGSRMLLEAGASNGEVTIDVPGLAVTRESDGRATGTMSGGTNAVRLFAEHGSVEISSALPSAASTNGTRDQGGDEDGGSPRR
jgi:DUF4097 and DUF4098 domain-containing protein YvlB